MFKHFYHLLVGGLICVLLASACTPSASAPDTRLSALEDRVNALSNLQTQITNLQGNVDAVKASQDSQSGLKSEIDSVRSDMQALSTQVDAMKSAVAEESSATEIPMESPVHAASAADRFALRMAQYVMDSSGYHEMAETISNTMTIDPAYLGIVGRGYKVLSETIWPEPLAEQGQAFVVLLKDFSTALQNDNVAEAVELSDQIHEAQHELSHAIDDFLGAATDAHTQ
jgi:hypothetical protein